MQMQHPSDAQVLLKQRLGRKPSCCLQDLPHSARSSKPLPQNSLRQKLSCCLQDQSADPLGHDPVVCVDSVPRPAGERHDISASSRDAALAISADCPGRPGGIQDQFGFCCGGIPNGGGVGIRAGCKQSVAGGRGSVETAVGNNNSGGRQTKRTPLPVIFKVAQEQRI